MRLPLIIGLVCLSATGCVSESTYVGSDKPVVENKLDKDKAARTRISVALRYLSTGDSTQAKYNLERALKFAPDLPEVHYTLAYYYQKVGENQQAKDAYEKAIDLAPRDPNTLNNYGAFLCSIGEYDAAEDYILKAIAIPSYLRVAESYENLALCAIESDRFDDAEDFLTASLKHAPLRSSALIGLAAISYAKSDLHKAQTLMQKHENAGRISSRSLMLTYLIETRMGHIQQASNIEAILRQTYKSSFEYQMVSNGKTEQSEFELLREKYRKSELRKLKKESPIATAATAQPKIKVVKKKANDADEKVVAETVDSAPETKQPETKPVQSVEVKKPATDEASSAVVTQAVELSSEPAVESVTLAMVDTPVSGEELVSGKPISQLEAPSHIMKAGENLFSISVKYNVKLKKLLEWNGLTESDPVYAGTKIYVNNPNIYHVVKEGDTLFSISVKYNILMKNLASWNDLAENAMLTPNRKLLLVNPNTYFL